MDKSNGKQKKLDPKEFICYDFTDKFSKQTKLACGVKSQENDYS